MAQVGGLRVLIVDDEPDATATLAKFLSSRGFLTDTASNGSEAFDSVRSNRFDVVMTDLRMPGMDGADFLAKMRVEQPDTPVIVMTGHTTLDTSDGLWANAGVAAVLQKPLNLRDISKILHDVTR